MSYQLWVAAGIVLGFLVSRLQREDRPELARWRPLLLLAAVVGSLAGALLLELPADRYGWTAGLDGAAPAHGLVLGRTVLGGLLGGWVAVEALKLALGIRGPTGDGFAAPLAIALACGRLGCAAAGCCAGRACVDGDWWAALAWTDHHGVARFPAQLVEVAFHATCAVVLVIAAKRGWLAGRRLAIYVALYAVLRFALETVRENPPVVAGLTYYQLLALALFTLAFSTAVARTVIAIQHWRFAASRLIDSGS